MKSGPEREAEIKNLLSFNLSETHSTYSCILLKNNTFKLPFKEILNAVTNVGRSSLNMPSMYWLSYILTSKRMDRKEIPN
jgi:hypothetical protein